MPNLNRDSTSIHYERRGSGSAIVFLHSFLSDNTHFRHQISALEKTHLVLAIDTRGHGRSSAATEKFTIYDLLDDAIAVLDAEGVGSAVWVGHSLGGFVAMRAALNHPERVSGLVLIGTEAGSQSLQKRAQDLGLKWVLRTFGPQFISPLIAKTMFGKTTQRVNPALVRSYRESFADMQVGSICHCIDAVGRRDDVLSRLREIQCPTLVVVGDEDIPLPPSKSRMIATRVHGASLTIIVGAGHLCPVEKPVEVTAMLLSFVGELQ